MESTFASVQDVCSALNEQASSLSTNAALLQEQKRNALMQLKVHPSAAGLIPSGPRKRGEGCDDENQGIVAAEETPTGGARLRVTLLAAGFVIGPGGSSIRATSQKSGADIRSWNDSLTTNGRTRRVRTIVIEGHHRSVVLALAILCEAIELYKELCEGKYCGKFVDRCQYIRGVEFVYSPPPRSAVPYAAALKPDGSNGSPASDGDGTAGNSTTLYGSPSAGKYATTFGSPLSASKMYLQSAAQKENQSIHALHSVAGGGSTPAAPGTAAAMQHGSAIPMDPGMVAALEAAAELYMSTNNSAVPMATDVDIASLQAELSSSCTAATAPPSALAAALARPSALSLLSQPGNMNSMAPDTPLALHKIYDPSNYNTAAGTIDANATSNTNIIVATAAAAAAPNSVQLPTPEFLKAFDAQNPTPVSDDININVSAPQPPQSQPEAEPAMEFPCYSLFGPDGNCFGPSLLRDIWGPNGNGPGLPPIPSWRGNVPIAVNDDQLSVIGLPSYGDFAEKSPYYSGNSNSLRNVLKSSEVPPLRINNNGFLFSAYEDNSGSATATTTITPTPCNSPSKTEYTAADNTRYMYYNPLNSNQDQTMYDAQQQNPMQH